MSAWALIYLVPPSDAYATKVAHRRNTQHLLQQKYQRRIARLLHAWRHEDHTRRVVMINGEPVLRLERSEQIKLNF
jgi:hypothetical protein